MKKIIGFLCIFILMCFPVKADEIEISSDYAYMFDIESGQVMLDINSDERIYPASMTKVMTLIVALENIENINDTFTFTQESLANLAKANATVAGYRVNDEAYIIDMMYGLMLPSGADCANGLALYAFGSIDEFVVRMNQKAQSLGMTNTNFTNPTGLHNENHYTSLRDMAKLMAYAYKNDIFMDIISKDSYVSSPTQSNVNGIIMESTLFKNIEKMGISIDGLIGGKTGYTNRARYCLASIGSKDGVIYILITAHAFIKREIPSHVLDAKTIYDYYFNNYKRQNILKKDDLLKTIEVHNNFFVKSIDVNVKEDFDYILKDEPTINVNLPDSLDEGIKEGDVLGNISIYQDDILIYQDTYYASKTIKKHFFASLLNKLDIKLILGLGIVVLFIIIILIRLLIKRLVRVG